MSDIIKAIEFCGIPVSIAIALVIGFLILQLIGEISESMGKVVPEFVKIRKYFKRKKDEKNQHKNLLLDVKRSLDEMNAHYSSDNITQRNDWMSWVNNRAVVYDAALKDLIEMKNSIQSNHDLVLDLYININRNRIIDFAREIANKDSIVSREEFNRIFKIYEEYEDVLRRHGKTNGEVDVAYRIISESYEEHMRNHSFIEDIREY